MARNFFDAFEDYLLSNFEIDRRQLSVSDMFGLLFVEHLDVVEVIALGILPCFIVSAANAYALEQVEAAFHDHVTGSVSGSAHRVIKIIYPKEPVQSQLTMCEL